MSNILHVWTTASSQEGLDSFIWRTEKLLHNKSECVWSGGACNLSIRSSPSSEHYSISPFTSICCYKGERSVTVLLNGCWALTKMKYNTLGWHLLCYKIPDLGMQLKNTKKKKLSFNNCRKRLILTQVRNLKKYTKNNWLLGESFLKPTECDAFSVEIIKTSQSKQKRENRSMLGYTSSSKPRRTFGWRTKTWTSVPSPLKIAANSKAIYPPPTIQILFGLEGRSRASSDVITNSLPGILGTVARPPTETKMCLAPYLLPFTSMVCASTIWSKRVVPVLTSSNYDLCPSCLNPNPEEGSADRMEKCGWWQVSHILDLEMRISKELLVF